MLNLGVYHPQRQSKFTSIAKDLMDLGIMKKKTYAMMASLFNHLPVKCYSTHAQPVSGWHLQFHAATSVHTANPHAHFAAWPITAKTLSVAPGMPWRVPRQAVQVRPRQRTYLSHCLPATKHLITYGLLKYSLAQPCK